MKTGPALIIDHSVLYGILVDDALYAVAALAPLRAQALIVYNSLIDGRGNKGRCNGCASFASVMRPIQDAIGQALAEAGSDDLDAFVAYVSRKRRYRPVPIVLYYVDRDNQSCKFVI